MRKLLAALALFAAPALAAIETTTITGTVYAPNGGAYPGKVTCTLSNAGTASDGTNQQVVASYYTATINSDGSLSMTLVPNDVITPAGTSYSCEYTVQPVGGRRMTWVTVYSVTTAPDPVALGAVAILSNPTLTLPTISGAANSMMATDGSGGLVATPALQRAASGNAVKFAGRYFAWDSNGDGSNDSAIVGDYDGDGTLEFSDIYAGDNSIFDANGDGTQDTVSYDQDGDGTVETIKKCGTITVLPGLYTGAASIAAGSSEVTHYWDCATLSGYGVTLKATVPVSTIRSSGATNNTSVYVMNVRAPSALNAPIKDVTIEGFTVVGMVSRLRECADPNFDGTANVVSNCTSDMNGDGFTDGAGTGVYVYAPQNVTVRDVTFLTQDRQGFSAGLAPTFSDTKRSLNMEGNKFIGPFGEHCTETDVGNVRWVGNYFSGCNGVLETGSLAGTYANQNQINAIELYCGDATNADGQQNITITGNVFEGVNNAFGYVDNSTCVTTSPTNISFSSNVSRRAYGSLFYLASGATTSTLGNISITGNSWSSRKSTETITIPSAKQRQGAVRVDTSAGTNPTYRGLVVSGNSFEMNRKFATALSDTNTSDIVISVNGNSTNPAKGVLLAENSIYLHADRRGANGGDSAVFLTQTDSAQVVGNNIICDNETQYDDDADGTADDRPACVSIYLTTGANKTQVSSNIITHTATVTGVANSFALYLAASITGAKITDNVFYFTDELSGFANGIGIGATTVSDVFLTDNRQRGGYTFLADNGGAHGLLVSRNNTATNTTIWGEYFSSTITSSISEGFLNVSGYNGQDSLDNRINAGRGWAHVVDADANGTLDDPTTLMIFGKTRLGWEGATANDSETYEAVVDPTADRTQTRPNASGTLTLALAGSTTEGAVIFQLTAATTCTTTCSNVGLTCRDAYPAAGGASVGCASTATARTCWCSAS